MTGRFLHLLLPHCESCEQQPATEAVRFGAVRFDVCADCFPTSPRPARDVAGHLVVAVRVVVCVVRLLVRAVRHMWRDRQVTLLLREFGATTDGQAYAAATLDRLTLAALDRDLDARARDAGLR